MGKENEAAATIAALTTERDSIKATLTAEREAIRSTLTAERDALRSDLDTRIAAQDDLALRAKAAYETAAGAFAVFGGVLAEALTPAEQKAAAAREAERASLHARLEALK